MLLTGGRGRALIWTQHEGWALTSTSWTISSQFYDSLIQVLGKQSESCTLTPSETELGVARSLDPFSNTKEQYAMKTMFMAKKHEATGPDMLLAQVKGSYVWPCCMTGACVAMLHDRSLCGHAAWQEPVWPCCMTGACVAMLHDRSLCGHAAWQEPVWPCCMTGACVPTLSQQINLKKQFNQTRVGKTAKITNNCWDCHQCTKQYTNQGNKLEWEWIHGIN